jgi:hypothetical protein
MSPSIQIQEFPVNAKSAKLGRFWAENPASTENDIGINKFMV